MNIHILFCPARTIATNGGLLPTASLALTLDDEVQYRCAGFIQAEIERFSEVIGVDVSAADDNSDEESTSEDELHGANDQPKVRKGGKKDGAEGNFHFLQPDS